MTSRNIVTTLFFFFFVVTVQAQKYEIGILAGGAAYSGDIQNSVKTFLPQLRPAIGIYGRLFLNDHFAVRGQIIGLRLYADEKKYPTAPIWEERGFSFKSQIAEFNMNIEWRPFKGSFQPYIYAGGSAIMFESKTFYNEPNTVIPSEEIAKDKKAIPPKAMFFSSIGGGLQFFLDNGFSIGGDMGLRPFSGDYLDGLSQQAGSTSKDYYVIASLTFAKTFGDSSSGNRRMNNRKVGCPTF